MLLSWIPGFQIQNLRLRLTIYNLPFKRTLPFARVVEWQTRTFEGRMPKGMRVQVPPRAPLIVCEPPVAGRDNCPKTEKGRIRSN